MDTVLLPSSTSSPHSDVEECRYLQVFAWRNMYLTEHTYRNLIALICVNSLAIIPTILLNALVIFVVATRGRLQTTSNILLACLAGTDLLTGLFIQPIAIGVQVKRAFVIEPYCELEKVYYIVTTGLIFASFSHLFLLSVDRYIAIKDPLRYWEIVTKKRITRAVVVAWFIAVVVTVQEIVLAVIDSETKIYLVYWTCTGVIASLVGLVNIVGISYCYVYIFSETRRQKKRLQTEQLSQDKVKRIKNDNKAANTLTLILGVLIITYLPKIISLLVELVLSNDTVSPNVKAIFSSWALSIVSLGSLANPIIYCWRNKKLRRAFLEICHLRQQENREAVVEMVKIQRHRSNTPPSNSQAFSMAVVIQEPL